MASDALVIDLQEQVWLTHLRVEATRSLIVEVKRITLCQQAEKRRYQAVHAEQDKQCQQQGAHCQHQRTMLLRQRRHLAAYAAANRADAPKGEADR